MEKNYFKPAGDLNVESKGSEVISSETNSFRRPGDLVGHFKPAGDLNAESKDNEVISSETNSFRRPDDLVGHFKPAGDLPVDDRKDIDGKNCTMDDIQDYLVSVVSGREYEQVCELGVLISEGEMIISFAKLKQMVDEGYNIVRAKAFNEDMIMVKFQKYSDDKELVERRRRF